MFNSSEMSSTASSLFSAYASYAALVMMIRSMANEVIPGPVWSYVESVFHYLFTPLSNQLTIVFDEHCGMSRNQVYDDAGVYLRTKISPNTERFKVGKTDRQKNFIITMEKGEVITDSFQNVQLKWKFVTIEPDKSSFRDEKRFFELSFNKKFKDKVMEEYLPFVLARSKEIREGDKVVKLYTRDCPSNEDDEGSGGGLWGSINLEHPSTFETLAMDPEMKKMIIDDLDRFLRRREYYKKVGKAWKRGYLLYGPPGTGKSSLIAAMANYLKFDIYDLELTSLYSNSDLRRILVSTISRSIIVIEDIDCSVQMHDRELDHETSDTKLTLSGVLNFIDGLWSTCGDERIIVFTTNHKDRLDPALLRPGRMDLHIHMSYCTAPGFRILASNYLGIQDRHRLFGKIEGLLETVEVTPAEVAEELMKSDDADVALRGAVNMLKQKQKKDGETTEEKDSRSPSPEVQETETTTVESSEKKPARGVRRRGRRKNQTIDS